VIFVTSCGIKQPIGPNSFNSTLGTIFVNSTPTGASIFLDNNFTGKLTPDSLHEISAGIHKIHIYRNGFRSIPDSIIIEVNSNSIKSAFFQLQTLTNTGRVFIQTEPTGAQIFVDEQLIDNLTPDTLILGKGLHQIKIEKNGFRTHQQNIDVIVDSLLEIQHDLQIRQRVLMESFANVSCLPCVAATDNLELFDQNQADSTYAIIEYFAGWPNPNDPFYLEVLSDVDARLIYYNVTGLPSFYIGGDQQVDATLNGTIDRAFADKYTNQHSLLGISISRQLDADSLKIKVEVFNESGQFIADDLRLFMAITEDYIEFENPPGSNGLKNFSWVFRGFISANEGNPLQFVENKSIHLFAQKWRSNFNYVNSHIVAFIQNITTKSILQVSYD
jgi:hypothetical protein